MLQKLTSKHSKSRAKGHRSIKINFSPPDTRLAAINSNCFFYKQEQAFASYSDEVELGLALFEVTVDHRRLLAFASTLAHKSCKSVSVADAGGLLDGTRDVVVVVAELESQKLYLVWGLPHCVIQHGEAGRHSHTLTSCNGHQVEFVGVSVRHSLVDDCTSGWVLEPVRVASEDPRVDTLAAIDIHQLASVRDAMCGEGLLDLLDLRNADALDLTLTNTVTVEDDPLRRRTVVALERLYGTCHASLQVCRTLLADLVLDDARAPVGCRRLIHRGSQSQDRFLAKSWVVEHIHATNHRRLVHERQIVHGPGCAAHLGVHLDQHLGDDGSQILATLDGGRQHHLGRDRILRQEEPLDIIVQCALSFLAGKKKNYHLDPLIQLLLERLDPSIEFHAWAHLYHIGFRFRVATLIQTLLHSALELSGHLSVSVTVEDAPSSQGRLREHLALNLAIQVSSIRLDVDRCRSATSAGSHLELAGCVLEAAQRAWHIVDLHVPQLLLLDALGVCLEVIHQVLDLLDLGVGIRVHDHCKVLHQAEISAHGISQARQLTELGDESDLISRASVLVDEQGLIHVADVLIVARTIVLLVRSGSPVFVEGS